MTTVTPLSRERADYLPESRRRQQLRGVRRSRPDGQHGQCFELGYRLQRIDRCGISDDQGGQPDPVSNAEELVKSWVPQIGVHQNNAPTGTGHQNGQVGGSRRRALSTGGGGDLDNAAVTVHPHELQRRPHSAVGLD